ncbi:integral membrane protein (PIN domain superfamily) [Rubidibacter lacunae KORDI 51-2]|uniref:Integral membrane protein (PIN domain superfamily) n=1 Tax=Rubidibacter lacunae KORDI 51-2 TaxID=582515 RepID=U5D642_9CHRO|nr:PIN/TRAM domain-containing protein [Rubidibacter lacunae]ERN40093.1 integral membrane protein (PIN domain superfamily) [Rubidibacter lacunae KORDI 51-2]
MVDAIIIALFILAAAGIGYDAVDLLPESIQATVSNVHALRWVTAGFTAIFGLAVGLWAQASYRRLEAQIRNTPVEIILTRSAGLAIGLLLANLMLAPLFLLPIPTELAFIKPLVAVLGSVMFAFMGVSLADTHGRSFLRLINPNSMQSILVAEGTLKPAATKVLDTSCAIDGRIEELLGTGFIEGQLLVPAFVLEELQRLADAANDRKRGRGRRGLDILKRMQEAYPGRLTIHAGDYEDVQTVDAKLIRLTQDIDGVLLTTDYNLNKVADLQQVTVLNVNDLAQAVRPLYLPGDTLQLKILKQGKEPAQGVGYLEDGTMVVVDDGREHLGAELPVIVTSALQTSAGRMIFAKPRASALAS